MRVLSTLSLAALSAPLASAAFEGNLNYHSPSLRHVNLGIDIPVVSRRSLKRSAVPFKPSELNFTHGIASGDPYPDSVILWTRVAPSLVSDNSNVTVEGTVALYNHETEQYVKADPNPICVEWQVWEIKSKGPAGPGKGPKKQVAAKGTAYTTSDIDYTVKVEAKGLKPFTDYNYQFTVCKSDNASPVGRTKTAPVDNAKLDELKLAVFSCSNYPNGYFNAYGNAARKDKHDYVIHLGDYIYEGAQLGERAHNPPHIIFSLWDYRTRHGQYRTDPDLQLLAQNYAWMTTWDDHEIANNGYRDGFSALNNTEESFRTDGPSISVDQRKMNAVRAYFEWMPIRQVDLDDNLRIWRSFKLGNLLDLIILDTRNYDRSITSLGWNDHYIDTIRDDASRTLMGSRQENWFYNQLTQSSKRGAAWRVIGSQIVFSEIGNSGDNWQGYLANRNRTLKHLYDNKIGNNVFLAGDSHQNWVSDVTWLGKADYDSKTGEGSVGVEFAGTAVSSSGQSGPILAAREKARALVKAHEVLQWQEGYYRGYYVLQVRKEGVTAQYFGSPSVATPNAWDLPLANFTVASGKNHLSRPIGGGNVEAGFVRGGTTTGTNVTLNTETGKWDTIGFENMFIPKK
ncbi:PhoD-like phosphatase-domain-containing protein [Chaetomium tenue]|uniref:PhoD-like phosphatase-domain-containing protein n=1 Tax=Chaetomium tenue TaxID=1854479 RepID=A0ACB7NUB6_9PEZI|nr:PhoD-like phosphatase-domain-containing protein [Chaetomium globosum]